MKYLNMILILAILLITGESAKAQDYSVWLDRCRPYRETVEQILDSEGVSRNYYYLMVAESKCRDKAESKAGAEGFWQLMPGTAKSYGCKDPHNLECATHAAAKYIKQLESRFRTFEEVIIAYNMGGHNYQKHGKSGQALGLVYRVKKIKGADK